LYDEKIMRDPETGKSRGFAFISYDSFESSDAAIEAMHGQHIMNRPITVTYAFKKDSKHERHGSLAERILAANNPNRRSTYSILSCFIYSEVHSSSLFLFSLSRFWLRLS
jgi:RNA recognition motif-containing protein